MPKLPLFFDASHAYQLHAERNDQLTINTLLPQFPGLSWDFLPLAYYARSHGFPPGKNILLHHANYTHVGGVQAKLRQLRQIRRMVTGGPLAYLAGCIEEMAKRFHRIPRKIVSILWGR